MIEYNIIKTLGKGQEGTVYQISINGINYALKIEHILQEHIKYSKYSPVWREINFCRKVANKYPDYFINLIDFEIIDSCDHKQYNNLKGLNAERRDKIIKRNASSYCVKKIYTLIDTTLREIQHTLNIKQLYSFIIQMFYIFYILHKYKYIHGDVHDGNIGVIKTNKQYITIFDMKIPTFGYIYKLIDFGLVLKRSDVEKQNMNEFEHKYKIESSNIIYALARSDFWNYKLKKHLYIDWKQVYEKFTKTKEYNQFKNISDDHFVQMFLFELLYIDKFRQLVIPNINKHFQVHLYVDIKDIIFILENNNNHKKVIKYFYNKLI